MHAQQEQTNGLEWMLVSPQVDEAGLARALVEQYFAGLYRYTYRLADSHPQALKLAVEALAAAVRQRHRISIESSLRAWLYNRAEQPLSQRRSWLSFVRQRFEKGGRTGGLAGLGRTESQLLALHYGHAFSSAESASVLEVPRQAVEEALGYARLAAYHALYPGSGLSEAHLPHLAPLHGENGPNDLPADSHLQSCPHCQEYATRLKELQAALVEEYHTGPAMDLESVLPQVLLKAGLGTDGNGRRSRSYWKELALVGLLVGGMVFLGSRNEVFTAFDARPTITLTATITPTPGPTSLPRLVIPGVENEDYFFYQYYPGDQDTLEDIAARSGLSTTEIIQLNTILERRPLLVGDPLTLVAIKERTPFEPQYKRPRLTLPPLSETSNPVEILTRMKYAKDQVTTYWADSIYIHNMQPFFIYRPPSHMRIQTWAGGDDLYLVAFGNILEYGEQTSRIIIKNNLSFMEYEGKFQASSPLGYGFMIPDRIADDPYILEKIEDFPAEVIGKGQAAGRDTVGLKIMQSSTSAMVMWVDVEYGLVLRLQLFEDENLQYPIGEVVTNAIEINVTFPPGLFFPPSSPIRELASGYQGRPLAEDPQALPVNWEAFGLPELRTSRTPIPEGFDWKNAGLAFQKLEGQDGIDVFAGDYYAGTMDIEASGFSACQRSPDGRQAAQVAHPTGLFYDTLWLVLVQLEPLEYRQILDQYGSSIHILAFSPGGSLLAYQVCQNNCRLSFYDQDSEREISSMRVSDFRPLERLVFSPDEKQAAVLESADSQLSRMWVYEIETGELLFEGAYNWEKGQVTQPGSPVEGWEGFPAVEQGQCAP
jgi:DNA-directed RNA polymerase specialized sigma24 family protein